MSSNPTNEELTTKIKDLELKLAAYEKEAARQLTSKEFQTLVNRSQDIIYRYDLTTRQFIFFNSTGLKFYGLDLKGGRVATPQSVLITIYPEDLDKVRKAQRKSFAPGSTGGEVEYRQRRPDGSLRWMHDRWTIIRDEAGNPVTIEGIVRDNTDQKQAEEKLQFIRYSLDNATDTMVCVGRDGRFIDVNDAFCRSVGYSREKLLSMTVHEIDPDYSAEIWLEFWERLKRSGSLTFESFHRTKEGKVIPVEIKATFFKYKGKEYHSAIARDITERKQAEEEKQILQQRLNRAEKMEALGTLAGGVAHDLNNVLGIVVGYSEMLLDGADKSSPLRHGLENVMTGGQRAAAIVDDLLTLARRGVPGRSILNLNKIIADCQKSPEFESLSYHHPESGHNPESACPDTDFLS